MNYLLSLSPSGNSPVGCTEQITENLLNIIKKRKEEDYMLVLHGKPSPADAEMGQGLESTAKLEKIRLPLARLMFGVEN